MDWSRAKSVLIISFFILNILLGFQLWSGKIGIDSYSEAGIKREETGRLLASKQIKVEAEVPESVPQLNEITVRFQQLPSAELKPLPEPFDRDLLSSAADIRGLLVKEMPEIGEYEHDRHASNKEHAVYIMNQLYEGLPMFEVRMELYSDRQTVHSYRKLYAEVQHPGSESGVEDEGATGEQDEQEAEVEGPPLLSAYTVLGSLAENYLSPGAVIEDIRLGYHGPIFETETQVLAPYWRVAVSGGDLYYVHAVSGAVEGPSTLSDTEENN